MARVTDIDAFERRVQHARWRLRTAAYGGPEWDAATAGLQAALTELEAARARSQRVILVRGRHQAAAVQH